jgi:hypothetical protein
MVGEVPTFENLKHVKGPPKGRRLLARGTTIASVLIIGSQIVGGYWMNAYPQLVSANGLILWLVGLPFTMAAIVWLSVQLSYIYGEKY